LHHTAGDHALSYLHHIIRTVREHIDMTGKGTPWEAQSDGTYASWTPWMWAPDGRRFCNLLRHDGTRLDTKWMSDEPTLVQPTPVTKPPPALQPPPAYQATSATQPVPAAKSTSTMSPTTAVVVGRGNWIWDSEHRRNYRYVHDSQGMPAYGMIFELSN
jgi:hypothetical protein